MIVAFDTFLPASDQTARRLSIEARVSRSGLVIEIEELRAYWYTGARWHNVARELSDSDREWLEQRVIDHILSR